MDNNDNGHDLGVLGQFIDQETASLVGEAQKLKQAQESGNFYNADTQARMGVIHSLLQAKAKDIEYRYILKTTKWANREEQDRAVKALAVCDLTGAVKARRVLLDLLTARSGGEKFELVHMALDALTRTTINTNVAKQGKAIEVRTDPTR